jgi:hypothetical protein
LTLNRDLCAGNNNTKATTTPLLTMDTSGSNVIKQDLYENTPQEKPADAQTLSKVGQSVPAAPTNIHNLNLRLIGNSAFNALVDERGSITWSCMPRFDADPVFCSLLRKNKDIGFFDIELQHFERSEQEYVKNTAILKTTLYDKFGTLPRSLARAVLLLLLYTRTTATLILFPRV